MHKYTVLFLFLTVICGSSLFYVSQRTRDARDEVTYFDRKISNEEEAIRILRAEWSYLNRPQRLESLSKKFLKIGKTKSYQFVRFDDLEVANNIVVEVPAVDKIKAKTSVAIASTAHPVIVEDKEEAIVARGFRDRVERLLEDNEVATQEKSKREQANISRFYKNMAFRTMIGNWGNE